MTWFKSWGRSQTDYWVQIWEREIEAIEKRIEQNNQRIAVERERDAQRRRDRMRVLRNMSVRRRLLRVVW